MGCGTGLRSTQHCAQLVDQLPASLVVRGPGTCAASRRSTWHIGRCSTSLIPCQLRLQKPMNLILLYTTHTVSWLSGLCTSLASGQRQSQKRPSSLPSPMSNLSPTSMLPRVGVRPQRIHAPIDTRRWFSSRCFWSHGITRHRSPECRPEAPSLSTCMARLSESSLRVNSAWQLCLQVGARTSLRHSVWPPRRSSHAVAVACTAPYQPVPLSGR